MGGMGYGQNKEGGGREESISVCVCTGFWGGDFKAFFHSLLSHKLQAKSGGILSKAGVIWE